MNGCSPLTADSPRTPFGVAHWHGHCPQAQPEPFGVTDKLQVVPCSVRLLFVLKLPP